MRIAIISPFQLREMRGIERFNWSLGLELSKYADVDILTWDVPNPVRWGDMPPNLNFRRMALARYYSSKAAVPFYVYWLLRRRYDMVVLCFAGYGESSALRFARLFRRICHIVVLHYPCDLVPHRYVEFSQANLFQTAEHIVSVSEYVADMFHQQYPWRSSVIHNGVDFERFDPLRYDREAMRRSFGVNDERPILVTAAALDERKGIQHVLRALPELLRTIPSIQYWVLGEGPYRKKLESLIEDLGLNNIVKLWGAVEDVERYYVASDIGLLLSSGEAFGLSVVEYMAMKLPVIASELPPFPMIVDSSVGILVNPDDTVAIVKAIESLLADPKKATEMGCSGRILAGQRYKWSHVAQQYLQLLGKTT